MVPTINLGRLSCLGSKSSFFINPRRTSNPFKGTPTPFAGALLNMTQDLLTTSLNLRMFSLLAEGAPAGALSVPEAWLVKFPKQRGFP